MSRQERQELEDKVASLNQLVQQKQLLHQEMQQQQLQHAAGGGPASALSVLTARVGYLTLQNQQLLTALRDATGRPPAIVPGAAARPRPVALQ